MAEIQRSITERQHILFLLFVSSPLMAKPLNFPLFISKRIRQKTTGRFSATIQRIAVGSIAVSLAVMIVSFFILSGFRRTIEDKIFSLGAHILVTKYSNTNSFDENPVPLSDVLYQHPETFEHVSHVQAFSTKAALLKTDEEVQGILLKGIDERFDTTRFASNLLEGRLIQHNPDEPSMEIVISQKMAKLLRLQLHDDVLLYFVQRNPRFRKVSIVGIYNTGLEDFDDKLILGDLKLVQQLNGWGDSLAGGFEVYIDDFDRLEDAKGSVLARTDYFLSVQSVVDLYPQLFDWLKIIDRNEAIFLIIVLVVAGFNMVSILLILIMERTTLVGLLKALGSSDRQVQKVFLYNAQWLILRGLAWGNGIGLTIAFLQYQFKLIPLDPENYYMEFVPILWNWGAVVLLNLATIALVNLVLLLPVLIVSRISPIRSIKFS